MSNNSYKAIANKLYASSELLDVVPLPGGVSADVYRIDLRLPSGEIRKLVLRAHRASHNGHPADLEFALLKGLSVTDVPVATPLLVDISGDVLAEPYLLIEFVDGGSHVAAEHESDCIKQLAAMLAKIHSVSYADMPPLPTRIDPLPELFSYLPKDKAWYTLRQRLQSLADTKYNDRPMFLHGDYWPENILWKHGKISAVLDWEDAAIGDPLSDVACCALELRYRFGTSRMQEFIQVYAQHRPIDENRLALWQVYVAAAAQTNMGNWGLEQAVEAHMRKEALASIGEAQRVLLA